MGCLMREIYVFLQFLKSLRGSHCFEERIDIFANDDSLLGK